MINWPIPEQSGDIVDELIMQIRIKLPVVNRIFERFNEKNLRDYFADLRYYMPQPLQAPADLLEALRNYITPMLGEQVAAALTRALTDYPVVLTANHHGVDYFAQSFQGNFLFFLYRNMYAGDSTAVPILSCGGVPLSNSSYPKGLLLYDAIQPDSGESPFKLPIFPNHLNQTVVHSAPRFNEEMVRLALKQLDKSFTAGRISKRAWETAGGILNEEYLDPLVLDQPDYSTQATLLNSRLGKRVVAAQNGKPEFIYIEFERIVSLLLKKDLINPDSLISRIFFDAGLRGKVIRNLDGQKGCWHYDKLTGLACGTINEPTSTHLVAGYGSVFFWGLDVLGRHFPLAIIDSRDEAPYLTGKDGFGALHRIPLHPGTILAALESKLIYPNLFTMFTVVSLARGFACVGGYFQSEYLPAIQKGLVQALDSIAEYRSDAEAVNNVATHFYLSGMMFILAGVGRQFAVPAGPIEMISRGGIKKGFIEESGSISVTAAHRIGLFNIYPDLFPRQERMEQWQAALACDLNRNHSKWVLPEEL